ncbi:MAG: hypothetical protein CMM76_10120 [Rhodospirillaceae bacterium]|nr:hypothetical protein [Rhodospirillaceae bacterium]
MSYRALSIAVVILLAITDIGWAAEEKVDTDVPFFFEMERLTIPVIRGKRVEQYVLFKITLELVDAESKTLVEKYAPRLKDAFYRALHDYLGFQRPGTRGINIRVIKARLMRAGARAIGKKKIKAVLIQRAFERSPKQ